MTYYYTTFFVNALARDFMIWAKYQLEDGVPTETFYDLIQEDTGWGWGKMGVMHDEETEPNWWRVYVNLTNEHGDDIDLDGALACVLTQTKSNPNEPRLSVHVSWHKLFPGSAWGFLKSVAAAYPEAAEEIAAWQASAAGQFAGKVATASRWYEQYIIDAFWELDDYIEQEYEHRKPTEPDLTYITIENETRTAKIGRGAELTARLRQYIQALGRDMQLYVPEMLDRLAAEWAYVRSQSEGEEGREAYREYLALAERLKAWQSLKTQPEEEATEPPNFEDWLRKEGVKSKIPEANAGAGHDMFGRKNPFLTNTAKIETPPEFPEIQELIEFALDVSSPDYLTTVEMADQIFQDYEQRIAELEGKLSKADAPVGDAGDAREANTQEVIGERYGTRRDLSLEDVKSIVARCKAFQERGGRITEFYRQQGFDDTQDEPKSYREVTLRKWLYDPKFN